MTMSHALPDRDGPPPVRPVFSAVTWKEIAHLVTNLPEGIIGFVYAVVMVSTAGGLSVTAIGLPLLAAGLFGSRLWGRLERARARMLLGIRVEEPSRLPGPGRAGGFFPWLWTAIKDPVGWRTVLYQLIRLPWGVLTFTVVLTGLFVLWPVLPYVVRTLANADRAMVRGLLSPSDDLERRIAELESDRGVVVDTAAADLRRIERDLHDGAQARLVALAMGLGLAKEKLLEDPEGAAAMVDEAHGEVKLALQELRDLARGIHPAVLTDRGLDAALSAVASRCAVPVKVLVDLPAGAGGSTGSGGRGASGGAGGQEGRPAEAIEGIAYFVVSELLQNVSKHAGAGARGASVEVWRAGGRLMLRVSDDGCGGADMARGSGLAGLAERLGAVDGVLVVDSPEGAGTVVTAELPWRGRGRG
ncbi:sensor domain-containing protein [Streptomyces sp. NPDC047014]|uniref:sensor histidine kinase n=1 Tax=Streptomyces sp. NPDC047014 TaxID=3155736 RepID=UPI0033D384E4